MVACRSGSPRSSRSTFQEILNADLEFSRYTADLYQQYRRHLGPVRYWLLRHAQRLVVPLAVQQLLQLTAPSWLRPVLPMCPLLRTTPMAICGSMRRRRPR